MQIDGGKNDGYAAWSDAGGLAMGHYDYSQSALYASGEGVRARRSFFSGRIRRLVPESPILDLRLRAGLPQCRHGGGETVHCDARAGCGGPLSAAAQTGEGRQALGPGRTAADLRKAATSHRPNYFGDGKFYAVNTMQPAYQPSGNKPAADDADYPVTPTPATPRPCRRRISEPSATRSTRSSVNWIWYAGAWNAALADGRRSPSWNPARRSMRPRPPAAIPTSSRITSPSIITNASIPRATPSSAPRTSRTTAI